MRKTRRFSLAILYIVLAAVLAGAAYYIFRDSAPPATTAPDLREAERNGEDTPRVAPGSRPSGRAGSPEVQPEAPGAPPESTEDSDPARTASPEPPTRDRSVVTGRIPTADLSGMEDYDPSEADERRRQGHAEDFCRTVESDMQEIFSHLDGRDYISGLDLNDGVYGHFKNIVAALSAAPPAPAGEGLDPGILLGNIYHIYRSLNLTDLRLIKRVLERERDDMEVYMQMMYRWLASSDECPDHTGVRPPEETVYLYAGFFLNTTGGRAILFRRSPGFRILFTYYCLLSIHHADREKRNTYGIDIRPFIAPLKEEIAYHPGLIVRDRYLSQLDTMAGYYSENR